MAVSIPWAAKTLPAIVETLRGGQSAGTALAGALFGATADPPLQPAMFNLGVSLQRANQQGRYLILN